MANKVRELTYDYKGIHLPVKVHFERRTSSRISIGREAILLRVPRLCSGPFLRSQLSWMGKWLQDTFEQKPEQLKRLLKSILPIQDGQVLSLFDRDLILRIREEKRKTAFGKVANARGELVIAIPEGAGQDRKLIASVISRALARHYLPYFEKKVRQINDQTFDQPINLIRLKNNSSNWGSCSSNGNINLSTRLLLVPESVQDYVIVHELAHLIELNHSPRFWQHVERVMPDYKHYETWLKEKGAALAF